MHIHEAVAEAFKVDGVIARPEFSRFLRIKPTNLPERCILTAKGKDLCPRWQPGAEDLLADDWTVTKEGVGT